MFFFVEIVPRRESSITNEWREFEVNSTYEYAHNEVRTLRNTSTPMYTQPDVKKADDAPKK